jgi:hypothetical protein
MKCAPADQVVAVRVVRDGRDDALVDATGIVVLDQIGNGVMDDPAALQHGAESRRPSPSAGSVKPISVVGRHQTS